jgi:hypothetical protein
MGSPQWVYRELNLNLSSAVFMVFNFAQKRACMALFDYLIRINHNLSAPATRAATPGTSALCSWVAVGFNPIFTFWVMAHH